MRDVRPLALTAPMLLEIWERGASWHPIDRALLVLSNAYPQCVPEQLRETALGERDALLLKARQCAFGDRLDAYVECPACAERHEFSLSCETLLSGSTALPHSARMLTLDGIEWQLRLPTSVDLAAVADYESRAAVEALLARCVERADGEAIVWSEALRVALVAELAVLDPRAEIQIELTCQRCEHVWLSVFDIAAFFWCEIRSRARRLLQEIDVLARCYGWSESEILQMSDTRRGLHVQMALS